MCQAYAAEQRLLIFLEQSRKKREEKKRERRRSKPAMRLEHYLQMRVQELSGQLKDEEFLNAAVQSLEYLVDHQDDFSRVGGVDVENYENPEDPNWENACLITIALVNPKESADEAAG